MIALACNSKIEAFWWCRWWGRTTTLYHCSVELGSGSESEGGGQVCCTSHDVTWTNVCEGSLKVKFIALYRGWDITTSQNPWISGAKLHESRIHKNWSSSPTKNKCLGHRAGVGHQLHRTGILSPIQSGGQSDGGCRWVQQLIRFKCDGHTKPMNHINIKVKSVVVHAIN